MRKSEIINEICKVGVVAVVRAKDEEEAVKISAACIEGGIKAIEVTFTVPGCDLVIKRLAKEFKEQKIILGAGTVLDSETARIAILNGAEYIVSPSFDLDTAKLCNRYQVAYMPGCMTITEVVRAMEAGAAICKIFPGSAFGPSFIKAIKAPLPQAVLMPTGGVNLDNISEWIKSGCVAVGIGGALSKPEDGTYEDVTKIAKKYVRAVQFAKM